MVDFIQTWHKAYMGDGDSNLFKWRATPFSKGDDYEKATTKNIDEI